jgi:hypothetical protein
MTLPVHLLWFAIGETGHPPSLHWVEVAARLRFTRQQKLQFKCALEVGKATKGVGSVSGGGQ